MEKYSILPITQHEKDEILKVANHVFGFGASLLISKKTMWGFYATDGEQIVGAVLLEKASETEGILAWIFIDESARGHKLASKLTKLGIETLTNEGFAKQFTLVRDDNTASWNMFLKNGYKIVPLYQALFGYSFKGFWKRLNYSLASGYSIWVKDDALINEPVYPKYPVARTLLGSIFIGAALSLFGVLSIEFLLVAMIIVLGTTLLRMIVAYPIARTYGPVRFKPSQGGFTLSVLLALLVTTWWPTFGFFVPKADNWNNHDFKKNEGYQALATWLSLNALYIFTSFVFPAFFSNGLNILLMLVIIYQMIPFFPLDGFDGAKVMRWNKFAYVIGVVLSLLTIIFFF